jgi:hypothetical protein
MPRVAMKCNLESCDVYFYDLASPDHDRMADISIPLALGSALVLIPPMSAPVYYLQRAGSAPPWLESWYPGETISAGIVRLYAGVAPAIGGCHKRHCKQGQLDPAFGDGRGWSRCRHHHEPLTAPPSIGTVFDGMRGGARPKRYRQGTGRWDYL